MRLLLNCGEAPRENRGLKYRANRPRNLCSAISFPFHSSSSLFSRLQRTSGLTHRILRPIPVVSVWHRMTMMRLVINVFYRFSIRSIESSSNSLALAAVFRNRRVGITFIREHRTGHRSLHHNLRPCELVPQELLHFIP